MYVRIQLYVKVPNMTFISLAYQPIRSAVMLYVLFFFSSRRRHTSWPRDWNSDVCSSDLVADYLKPRTTPPAGIILANPNAPTGLALSIDEIAQIAQANPDTAVVIDEAYVDFGAQSAVVFLADHPNIVVLQTLSKSRALAGSRVGVAIASSDVIAGLLRVKNSFNSYPLDRVAQAAALAAIEDADYFEETRQALIAARTTLSTQLKELGFEVLPSQANFVFAKDRKSTRLNSSHVAISYA